MPILGIHTDSPTFLQHASGGTVPAPGSLTLADRRMWGDGAQWSDTVRAAVGPLISAALARVHCITLSFTLYNLQIWSVRRNLQFDMDMVFVEKVTLLHLYTSYQLTPSMMQVSPPMWPKEVHYHDIAFFE